MKRQIVMLLVVLSAAPAVSDQSMAAQDPVIANFADRAGTSSRLSQSTLKSDVPNQTQIAVPSQSESVTVFRDVPSIYGRYSLGGKTILPFVGAGFGGGYASEFNRSLSGTTLAQTESGLRSQFGQGFSPNEFQLGVRIPF